MISFFGNIFVLVTFCWQDFGDPVKVTVLGNFFVHRFTLDPNITSTSFKID